MSGNSESQAPARTAARKNPGARDGFARMARRFYSAVAINVSRPKRLMPKPSPALSSVCMSGTLRQIALGSKICPSLRVRSWEIVFNISRFQTSVAGKTGGTKL